MTFTRLFVNGLIQNRLPYTLLFFCTQMAHWIISYDILMVGQKTSATYTMSSTASEDLPEQLNMHNFMSIGLFDTRVDAK
jgi:hypothetical protein